MTNTGALPHAGIALAQWFWFRIRIGVERVSLQLSCLTQLSTVPTFADIGRVTLVADKSHPASHNGVREVITVGNRKVNSFEKAYLARAFAVLLLLIGAVTGLSARAQADSCAAVDVVVARGTQEPGWLGAVIGDPLYGTLRQTLPASSSAYRVNYPADLLDPASLSRGTQDMTDHLVRQSAQCPDQRFVLVGYSQGAAVVHGVVGTGSVSHLPGIHMLPGHLEGKVSAVLLFGDPIRLFGWGVPGNYAWKTVNYCAGGDPICGGGFDSGQHANYGWAMWPAAWYAAAQV